MRKIQILSALCSFTVASVVSAATAPTVETFSSGNANWSTNNNSIFTTPVVTGGPAGLGDAYISSTSANIGLGESTSIFARASLSNNASGSVFTGSYASIYTISFDLRHSYTEPLKIGVRLGGAVPGTAISALASSSLAPNQWTKVSYTLTVDNPALLSYEGTPGANDNAKFANATANIANLQFFSYGTIPAGTDNSAGPVTFDVDNVTLSVPEPTSLAALSLAGVSLLARRRRQA